MTHFAKWTVGTKESRIHGVTQDRSGKYVTHCGKKVPEKASIFIDNSKNIDRQRACGRCWSL